MENEKVNNTCMTEETPKTEREKILQIIKDYRPMDDEFMRELFRDDIPLTEYVLRIITGIKDLNVTQSETQFDLHSLTGSRSLRLDVLGTDSEGKKYNLEVQRSDAGAAPKRLRYHSSAIDIEILKSGEDFTELPETYVIFITENDVMGKGKLIYQYEWREEDGSRLEDGAHIIFVNAAYDKENDDSELAKLMHDFRCSNASDMLTEPLANKTRKLKETPEGVDTMCKAIEENNKNVAKEKSKQIAINFLNMGLLSYEAIAKGTDLSVEEVEELAKALNHTA